MGLSGDTVRNYISLTQLVPELQKMVDDKKIALSPAYQLSALKPEEQTLLLDTIESEQATPSLSQAQRMKQLKGGQADRRYNAVDYDGAEEAGEKRPHPVRREAPQILPSFLYAAEDGGNHTQAAGSMDEKAAARSGAINEYKQFHPTGQGQFLARFFHYKRV